MRGSKKSILVEGARQNTLKNVTVRLPIGELTVVTGVSGSGKSSFAFDTVYAEGQRRYVETFSPYARQFLERMDRPRVDRVEGIPPAIAIDQTNPVRTSRSTVGTMTELADHLKLLYARAARLFCGGCGREVRRDSPETIADTLDAGPGFAPPPLFLVTFPVPIPANFTREEIEGHLARQGYTRVRPAGEGALEVIQDRVRADARRIAAASSTRSRPRCGSAAGGWRSSRWAPTGARARRGASRRTCTAPTATGTTRTRRRTSSPSIRRSAPARPAGASAARSASTCASWCRTSR